jgi:hypothetical protein
MAQARKGPKRPKRARTGAGRAERAASLARARPPKSSTWRGSTALALTSVRKVIKRVGRNRRRVEKALEAESKTR